LTRRVQAAITGGTRHSDDAPFSSADAAELEGLGWFEAV
jgi:hypothetical protein